MIGTHVLTDIDTQGLYGGRVGNSFRRDRLLATEGATVVEGGVGGKGSGRYGGGGACRRLSSVDFLGVIYTHTDRSETDTDGAQMGRQMGRQTRGADEETDGEADGRSRWGDRQGEQMRRQTEGSI